MRADPQVVHNEDIGEIVGEFHGTAIHTLSHDTVELREIRDAQVRARMSLGIDPPEPELLPGETLVNNIIRRETTAEARGK